MSTRTADVAVVGLGAWGSATLWQLAARGVRVIGIEQFEPGHANGSSHGGSRMFRTSCLEHSGLVPLAERSLTLWRELESAAGQPLFNRTGGMLIGPPDTHIVAGTRAAAADHGIPVEVLDAGEVHRRFPAHDGLPDDHVAVWEPTAGLVDPERAIRAAVATARAAGARTYVNTKVTDIELIGDGAVLRTSTQDFNVAQVVVTTGAWATALVPDLPLTPIRMPMTWFRPAATVEPFTLKNFPVFIRELANGGVIWGHGWDPAAVAPGRHEHDVKLGLEDGGGDFLPIDPDTADHVVTPQDWRRLATLLPAAVPGLGEQPSAVARCMVTRTPDRQFVLGRPGGDRRLVVGVGCAGHGFKHASGIGEALADVVQGRETHCPLEFTDPNRFR